MRVSFGDAMQGDSYEELGVKVEDVNDDESERKIKIVFSKPPGESRRRFRRCWVFGASW